MKTSVDDEMTYRVLGLLEQEPNISQRELSDKLGISLGKTNYCMRALIDKGLIKVTNFRASDNKKAYVYLLTPSGLEEKARATVAFLRKKRLEYDALRMEIDRLQEEVHSQQRELE